MTKKKTRKKKASTKNNSRTKWKDDIFRPLSLNDLNDMLKNGRFSDDIAWRATSDQEFAFWRTTHASAGDVYTDFMEYQNAVKNGELGNEYDKATSANLPYAKLSAGGKPSVTPTYDFDMSSQSKVINDPTKYGEKVWSKGAVLESSKNANKTPSHALGLDKNTLIECFVSESKRALESSTKH